MKRSTLVLVVIALMAPATAQARTCLDGYYMCLNDTQNTSGLLRYIADTACAAAYYACSRSAVK